MITSPSAARAIATNCGAVSLSDGRPRHGTTIEITGGVFREGSKALTVLEDAKNFAAAQRSVPWIDINRDNLSGKIVALPKREDIQLPVNEQLIVELYSK